MDYIVYRFLRFILKPFFMLLHGTKYEGLENIPEDGPVILAGNHKSILDAFIMPMGPKRIIHMLAKKELFDNKLSGAFFKSLACISVDRSIHDEKAKSEALDVLKSGNVLGIFPEGTINRTNDIIMPFKYGAVSFAKKTNVCIIPFAITGSYNIFKRNLKQIYGKPYKVTGDLEKENKKLMKKVENLIKKGREE